MTGSLLQIVSTDLQDTFLTIDPQITFFKIVYLKHTIFAIDIIEETFNTVPNFGEEGFCELSKYGDLVSNIFLKVEIPSVLIKKNPDIDYIKRYNQNELIDKYSNNTMTSSNLLNYYNNLITQFEKFSKSAMFYWSNLKIIINTSTSNYLTVVNYITNIINSQNDLINVYNSNLITTKKINNSNLIFNFDLLNYLLNNYSSYKNSIYISAQNIEYKQNISSYLSDYIFYQNIYLKYLYENRDTYLKIINIEESSYYYFSWVNKLAFSLINYISIEIGGQQVDKITSEILNNWYELSTTIEKQKMLDTMIGNVVNLTSYDNNIKPAYTLLIPIPFWFSKYKSQALPCVGLKYNDIVIKIQFNELYKCCYFEPDEHKEYSTNININQLVNINSVSLLIEYIQLGNDERIKFGTFSNETLIEQHKVLEFINITNDTLLPLDFVNPIRELIWTIQTKSYINDLKLWNDFNTNYVFRGATTTVESSGNMIIDINNINNPTFFINGYVEIFHSKYYNGIFQIIKIVTNYITIKTNFIYPDNFKVKLYNSNMNSMDYINTETIQIYGNDLISKRDSTYFTTVQNFQNHTNIPNNIHCYSFCLNCENFQPSGALNFSVIDSKNLYLNFNNDILDQINNNDDSFIVKIIGRSHNILSFENGMAKVRFGI